MSLNQMSIPKRKSGWERAKELEKKKRRKAEELKKTHKLTSFFSVLGKDASSGDSDDSTLIPHVDGQVVTGTNELISGGADIEPQPAVSVEDRTDTISVSIPNDVGLFSDITDHIRELCIGLGASHFRNLVDSYPATKRDYSGVSRFLYFSAFKRVLPT